MDKPFIWMSKHGLTMSIKRGDEARALLAALADHLHVELPPVGWSPAGYTKPGCGIGQYERDEEHGGGYGWFGNRGDALVGPCPTAQAAADAVAALQSEGEGGRE